MSVQNESLEIHKTMEKLDDAPGLEYRAVAHDSLSMFLAAIVGAILGMLLTLLVLAIINNGTLSFASANRVDGVEQTLYRVNENVGTLSVNLDTAVAEVNNIRAGLQAAQANLETAVADQTAGLQNAQMQIDEAEEALATLQVTRQQFDTFIAALSAALSAISTPEAPTE
jgi:septal ring factor EnvC (AmiA/AmiB activator)